MLYFINLFMYVIKVICNSSQASVVTVTLQELSEAFGRAHLDEDVEITDVNGIKVTVKVKKDESENKTQEKKDSPPTKTSASSKTSNGSQLLGMKSNVTKKSHSKHDYDSSESSESSEKSHHNKKHDKHSKHKEDYLKNSLKKNNLKTSRLKTNNLRTSRLKKNNLKKSKLGDAYEIKGTEEHKIEKTEDEDKPKSDISKKENTSKASGFAKVKNSRLKPKIF